MLFGWQIDFTAFLELLQLFRQGQFECRKGIGFYHNRDLIGKSKQL
jgi:hypothetical protein